MNKMPIGSLCQISRKHSYGSIYYSVNSTDERIVRQMTQIVKHDTVLIIRFLTETSKETFALFYCHDTSHMLLCVRL